MHNNLHLSRRIAAATDIRLDWLLSTQNGLRNHRQVEKMIHFVEAGGRFTKDARLAQSLLAETGRSTPPPVHIALMEDGQMVLHDGHHRAVALFLGGRHHFDLEEYEIVEYTYADYSEMHPEKGWFTPFDLKTEVRLPDFGDFKRRAKAIYAMYGIETLRAFTSNNFRDYKEVRRISSIEQLVGDYHVRRRTVAV